MIPVVVVVPEDSTLKTSTWIGFTSIDWTDGSNWKNGMVPTLADAVIIPSSTPFSPTVPPGIIASCKSMIVLPGAAVTIGANANLIVNH